MSTQQPKWKLVAQLGDVNPLKYGGHFVYVDETGAYGPESEILVVPEYEDESEEEQSRSYEVRRYVLEKCTHIDGILSDNKHHPRHPAWFAQTDKIDQLAQFCGTTKENLIEDFCSENIVARAKAWESVGQYYGFENLDDYPLFLTRDEAEARYKEDIE